MTSQLLVCQLKDNSFIVHVMLVYPFIPHPSIHSSIIHPYIHPSIYPFIESHICLLSFVDPSHGRKTRKPRPHIRQETYQKPQTLRAFPFPDGQVSVYSTNKQNVSLSLFFFFSFLTHKLGGCWIHGLPYFLTYRTG